MQVDFHLDVQSSLAGNDGCRLQGAGVGRGDDQLTALQHRVFGSLFSLLHSKRGQWGEVAALTDEAAVIHGILIRFSVADEDDSHALLFLRSANS